MSTGKYFSKNGNISDIKYDITIDGNTVVVCIDRVFLLNRKHNVTMKSPCLKLIEYQLYSVWGYFISFRKLSCKTYLYLHFILQRCFTLSTIEYFHVSVFVLIICFNLLSIPSLKSQCYVKRWIYLQIDTFDSIQSWRCKWNVLIIIKIPGKFWVIKKCF